MAYPEKAVAKWFGKGRQNDVLYLRAWRDAPLTYSPEQEIDPAWNVDRYETILGHDSSGALFERAANLTLRNQFYPKEVMVNVSEFGLENRTVQAGDRVLQRIRLLQYKDKPILEALTVNEITDVIQEPRRAGFTYVTTAAHSELGEWSPVVEWRENGEVALVISVVSRTRPGSSYLSRRLARRLQLRAHKLSIQNFLARLNGVPFRPEPGPAPRLQFLPVALLLLSALIFVITFSRRER